MTYWVYKLTYDCGTAPHVRNGLLSLAICKPRIRERAARGDVLFGFSGRSRSVNRGERLIYMAEVTEKLARAGDYYDRAEFRDRWDCIYERKGELLVWRPGSLTHEDEGCRARDLGLAPSYFRAVVLLSDNFRYLGADGDMDYARRWPNLATYVHELGIGERDIKPASEVGRMLTQLRRHVWSERSAREIGPPTEPFANGPTWETKAKSARQGRSCARPRNAGRCG